MSRESLILTSHQFLYRAVLLRDHLPKHHLGLFDLELKLLHISFELGHLLVLQVDLICELGRFLVLHGLRLLHFGEFDILLVYKGIQALQFLVERRSSLVESRLVLRIVLL